MKNNEVLQNASAIVSDAFNEKTVANSEVIADRIVSLLNSVDVDSNAIEEIISDELSHSSANPINRVLGLSGRKIIKIQEVISKIKSAVEGSDIDLSTKPISLNDNEFETAVIDLAEILAASTNEVKSQFDALLEQNRDMNSELDKVQNRLNQEIIKNEKTERDIGIWAQKVLSSDATDETKDAANQLLYHLSLSAVFSGDDLPLAKEEMFAELHLNDPDSKNEIPCIMSGDRVVCSGTIFIK
ncbi:MAG: hypothetical protein K6G90_11085 [Clostridia bacterium]|nr:hypothetical protein [Clostridia bacterium]